MKFSNLARGTFRPALVSVMLALSAAAGHADVKLNGLFSDGLVLQQGVAVPIWGSAGNDEKVVVRFQDQQAVATAQGGHWLVRLQPLKPGGPFTMTIAGNNTVAISNIMVGEVWVCSGQSNMAFPLSRAANARDAIAAAGDPNLRLFSVPRGSADKPESNVAGSWKESTSETASNFSAVAWFFGRNLRQTLKVPVGLIHSSVGGTPAEAWTSRAALEADPDLKQIIVRYAEAVRQFDSTNAAAQKQPPLAKDGASTGNAGQATKAKRSPAATRRPSGRTSGLYNAMIAPLQPYAIAGVIWYQGEANSARAMEYRKLFPAMIRDWRQAWGQGDFPFLFVQIAPHQRMTPDIREAQLLTWQTVPRTAMAVITDIGNETDIHPTKKEPVGDRLALAARAIAYGQRIEYSGPVYDSIRVDGNHAILSFTHLGGGLKASGGELKGFTVAGQDGSFVGATANISGDTVIVSSPSVAKPVAVRYGWASTPDVNLFNQDGLPASPFRTDK